MGCLERIVIINSACFDSINNPVTQTNLEAPPLPETTTTTTRSKEKNEAQGSSSSSSLSSFLKMVECRICQEEDYVHAMEIPCSCNGTLKFAHRRCIQRWCNKKGDVTCEICNTVFSPNYTIPPSCSNPDVLTIDIRQAWREQINLHDSHIQALAAAERQLLEPAYEDCVIANSSSVACLRTIGLVLIMVLMLHQALMLIRDFGMVQEWSKFFNVSLIPFAGFLLSCYVMARTWYIMQTRRRRQG